MKKRLKEAVSVLNEGGTIKLGDIRLGISGGSELTVTGWTRYQSLENLSEAKALSELGEIKSIFAEMLNVSPELRSFAESKAVSYYLGQNYGQGAIGICKDIDGAVTWDVDL